MKRTPCFVRVLERSRTKGNDRLVLLAVASYAKPDGSGAWPPYEKIAHRAGVHRATVARSLRRLVELGELEIEYKAGLGGTNLYTVVLPDEQPGQSHDVATVEDAIEQSHSYATVEDFGQSQHAATVDSRKSAETVANRAPDSRTALRPKQEEHHLQQDGNRNVPTPAGSGRSHPDDFWACPTDDCPGVWPADVIGCNACGAPRP